ncbi:MAG: RNA polymerase sigma factor [Bacteroidia bacterium]
MNSNPHEEFLRYYKPVHTAFVRYCSSHAFGIIETDDLVQDSVLATMKSFHSIRDREKLLPFMISVANNIVRSRLRRKKFDGKISETQLKNIESRVTSPDMVLDIQYLYKALNKLQLAEKEAVILFEINGFSMREIAEMQHTTEGATRVRIHRARHKLREALTEEGTAYDHGNGKTLFSFIL